MNFHYTYTEKILVIIVISAEIMLNLPFKLNDLVGACAGNRLSNSDDMKTIFFDVDFYEEKKGEFFYFFNRNVYDLS